ncbi:MAG: hypothetical protein R3330_12305, partial [Saprospiraceae bacterium]|nr:hypothetical protein [Saprospiraceae bacterium]
MAKHLQRRTFLEFLGKGTIGVALSGQSFGQAARWLHDDVNNKLIRPISPSNADELTLAPGFEYHVLIKWGDRISA